ncbi:hypothetical protein BTVI_152927 [Pitangus sulphuratus]|nr:hypothetical protein BTVI_152927 [Pitangus sulphuratus]
MTELEGMADTLEGRGVIHRDLNRLSKNGFTGTSQSSTKQNKKVLYLERKNPSYQQSLGADELESSLAERVLVDTELNMSQKYALTVKKAKSTLSCIRRNAVYRLEEVMLYLCSVLEDSVQFWPPHYKADMDTLERNATEMIKGLQHLT